MKPIKSIIILLVLALAIMSASSCNTAAGQWLSDNVPVVNNRDANGKFVTPVSPKDGRPANASATLYHFEGGDYGVSLWNGAGLNGTAPKLQRGRF